MRKLRQVLGEAIRDRRVWLKLGACAGTGILTALVFPPFDIGSLVWLALIPMLIVLWRLDGPKRAWKGAFYGGVTGLVTCGIQFYWFGIVAPVAGFLLPAYLATYWAAFGAFAATLGNPWKAGAQNEANTLQQITRSLRFGFCNGAAWVGLEWIRSWMLTGFGWNSLGVAFHQTPVLAQAADLLGVTGLSLVPIFLQVVLLQSMTRLIVSARTGSKQRTRLDFGIAALLVAFLICYGLVRIASESRKESIRVKALLVQLNVPQQAARVLWDPLDIHMGYEDETIAALENILNEDTRKLQELIEAAEEGEEGVKEGYFNTSWPDWVMWPEAALGGSIFRAENGEAIHWIDNRETLRRISEAGRFQLIYGVTEFEAVPHPDEEGTWVMKEGGDAWNSLAIQNPKEEEALTHRKHHLVWFGETIPLIESIPWLKSIYEAQSGAEYGGSFTPGYKTDPLPVPLANGKVIQAIPTICYEDSVPRLTRKFVRPEPQIILNVTNDGWFKESPAAAQHFAYAKFRCIELRRPMIRCANNGVSAAINTIGTTAHPDTGYAQVLVDENGSHFTRGSLLVDVDIPKQPTTTLFSVIGNWGVVVISLLGLAISILAHKHEDRELQLAPEPKRT